MFLKTKLKDKVVVITGSTGGLGSLLAQTLAAKGCKLALLDIDPEAILKQVNALQGTTLVRGWNVNVRSYEQLEQAMQEVAQHFGAIDVVIANAGVEMLAGIETAQAADFERVIDINLNGVFRTFKAAVPFVIESKGYMLAISSMAAFIHSPLQASYTASKAGVWAMVNSIRQELASIGVGVGSVHPTFFQTPMLEHMLNDKAGQALWQGNDKGIWKPTTIDMVVAETVSAIEHRKARVTVPKRNMAIARAPGVFQAVVERIGFKMDEIRATIDSMKSASK